MVIVNSPGHCIYYAEQEQRWAMRLTKVYY